MSDSLTTRSTRSYRLGRASLAADSNYQSEGEVMDEIAAMRRVADATRAYYALQSGIEDVLGEDNLRRRFVFGLRKGRRDDTE